MKIHIVFDQPSYETATIIAAYADRGMADRRVEKMKRQKESWLEVQRQKEANSEEDAYCGAPPHEYDDLGVMTLRVIPNPTGQPRTASVRSVAPGCCVSDGSGNQ